MQTSSSNRIHCEILKPVSMIDDTIVETTTEESSAQIPTMLSAAVSDRLYRAQNTTGWGTTETQAAHMAGIITASSPDLRSPAEDADVMEQFLSCNCSPPITKQKVRNSRGKLLPCQQSGHNEHAISINNSLCKLKILADYREHGTRGSHTMTAVEQ